MECTTIKSRFFAIMGINEKICIFFVGELASVRYNCVVDLYKTRMTCVIIESRL